MERALPQLVEATTEKLSSMSRRYEDEVSCRLYPEEIQVLNHMDATDPSRLDPRFLRDLHALALRFIVSLQCRLMAKNSELTYILENFSQYSIVFSLI